jgi:hypothetical protein
MPIETAELDGRDKFLSVQRTEKLTEFIINRMRELDALPD